MFFRPVFFSVGCNPLLGHGVHLVCPYPLFFFFFLMEGKRIDQNIRIEKKVQGPLHTRITRGKGQVPLYETFVSVI